MKRALVLLVVLGLMSFGNGCVMLDAMLGLPPGGCGPYCGGCASCAPACGTACGAGCGTVYAGECGPACGGCGEPGCGACGGPVCGGCCEPGPLSCVFGLLGSLFCDPCCADACCDGCGEKCCGEWGIPKTCDPCDRCGNWVGGGCATGCCGSAGYPSPGYGYGPQGYVEGGYVAQTRPVAVSDRVVQPAPHVAQRQSEPISTAPRQMSRPRAQTAGHWRPVTR